MARIAGCPKNRVVNFRFHSAFQSRTMPRKKERARSEKDDNRRQTDIAIAGGGLAGSTAAAMLGRAGCGVTLVDPHAVYPRAFPCKKTDATQAAVLRKPGLADAVLRAATLDGESWVARFGRLLEK